MACHHARFANRQPQQINGTATDFPSLSRGTVPQSGHFRQQDRTSGLLRHRSVAPLCQPSMQRRGRVEPWYCLVWQPVGTNEPPRRNFLKPRHQSYTTRRANTEHLRGLARQRDGTTAPLQRHHEASHPHGDMQHRGNAALLHDPVRRRDETTGPLQHHLAARRCQADIKARGYTTHQGHPVRRTVVRHTTSRTGRLKISLCSLQPLRSKVSEENHVTTHSTGHHCSLAALNQQTAQNHYISQRYR